MSATFKNAKKKLSQAELRKYMNEHKSKAKEVKKIESPLAKYNELGQLTCILCQSVVRSEAVWMVHVNAKQHKQNVDIAKKLKERTQNFTTPLKRPLTPPLSEVPDKKVKGILKNSFKLSSVAMEQMAERMDESESDTNGVSQDFIDIGKKDTVKKQEVKEEEDKDVLPEGFFDDPKLDAKARNQEYKDPIDEEWERFMKAMKEADNESNAIIAEDQEEATTERQIDEIDEQMKKLSRVLDLEKKKEEIIAVTNEGRSITMMDKDDNVDDEFDEFLDWREKKSFK